MLRVAERPALLDLSYNRDAVGFSEYLKRCEAGGGSTWSGRAAGWYIAIDFPFFRFDGRLTSRTLRAGLKKRGKTARYLLDSHDLSALNVIKLPKYAV